jgi:hypothetical protein
MSLNIKALVVIVLAILLLATFTVVAYVEGAQKRVGAPPPAVASAEAQQCITCHENKSPGIVAQWRESTHAEKGVDCLSCHKVAKDDFDYFQCPGASIPVASHPTPKDCKECHEKAVVEFSRSKHAGLNAQKFATSPDRLVFEPTIATQHGCQQCHNIGHVWPDQSVGECDACHAKHTFSLQVARNPQTCGECHLGPDHSHIEQWVESKHGNIFMSDPDNYKKLAYKSKDYVGKPTPLRAPTCTTCHMDATATLPATHDVGERLAWESQSPWSIRTTEAWGNGYSWQEKRDRMENACSQCHTPNFYQRYLLSGDLASLQYNEIFREGRRWLTEMNKAGIFKTAGVKDGLGAFLAFGYDEAPEEQIYHAWHHQGRLYRQGALMMAADYTQWHGIWEVQRSLVEIIRYGAEHNLPEAQAWMKSDDPSKYMLYPLYDLPGTAWGIDTIAFRKSPEYTTRILMNRDGNADYWDKAKANVEAAYKNNLLSAKQWELWMKMYNNRDKELGNAYPLSPEVMKAIDGEKKDNASTINQAIEFKLPAGSVWSQIWNALKPK